MLREKFAQLTQKMSNNKDDIKIIEDAINECGKYIECVNAMEAAITTARFRMEPEDYRIYIEELDKKRKITHDSLIVSVKLINKFCRLYDFPLIYEGDTESRIAIAEFAKKVVDEMFETRKL